MQEGGEVGRVSCAFRSAFRELWGTVEELYSSPLAQSRFNYVVQCRVDKILSGDFSGKTFSFRIHSPSQSGLEVGKQYKIEAKRTPEGFAVDQYQWMK